jgi:cholesterol transport system auxiliary component
MRRVLAGLLATALACAGCAGSLLESDATAPETYRLEGVATTDRGDRLPFALSVVRPRAAAALDSERIAVVQSDSRFDHFSAIRWSEPAPQMLQQLIVRAFTADGRFEAVVAAPSRVPADLVLDVELRRFEASYEGTAAAPSVRVEMQVTLVDARQPRRITSFVASASVVADANRRTAVLQAFERATAAALEETVSRVRAAVAPAG